MMGRYTARNGPVALKLLDLQGAAAWKTHELFEREANVLHSLRHHSAPEIYDTAEVDWQSRRVPVLVMTFIEGSACRRYCTAISNRRKSLCVRSRATCACALRV